MFLWYRNGAPSLAANYWVIESLLPWVVLSLQESPKPQRQITRNIQISTLRKHRWLDPLMLNRTI